MTIDYWQLAKDFAAGDIVQRLLPGQGISPFSGRVLASLPGLGVVDVQWPYGSERVFSDELLKVDPRFGYYLPPTLTFDYFPGLDVVKQASVNKWRTTEVPAGFHKELARLFSRGSNEIQAYNELWHRYASYSHDDALRDEVDKFYRFASNTLDLYLQATVAKTATYWMAQNRQHRATRKELLAKCPNCPRCGTAMRRTTYKMREGQKMRLFACPVDLFIIKRGDIFGPDGNPVEW
jgi:hypothetical protein